MIKVQQATQNPSFLEEAGDYLIANGYTRREGSLVNGTVYFLKGDKTVVVYNDNVDFLIRDEGEPEQRNALNVRYMALTGIADLDLFKWMLLFHIADIVPMKQFIKKAKQEDPAGVAALNGVFVTLFDHFPIAEPVSSVPLGY